MDKYAFFAPLWDYTGIWLLYSGHYLLRISLRTNRLDGRHTLSY